MGTWKFLVQREGKHAWTALEGEVMSLEPGRYRIAARAPAANTPVAIEIAVALLTGENRSYRRNTRTNEDGLLAVIPFTELDGGNWRLSCQTSASHVTPEAASISWQVVDPANLTHPTRLDNSDKPDHPAVQAETATERAEVEQTGEAGQAIAPEVSETPEMSAKEDTEGEPAGFAEMAEIEDEGAIAHSAEPVIEAIVLDTEPNAAIAEVGLLAGEMDSATAMIAAQVDHLADHDTVELVETKPGLDAKTEAETELTAIAHAISVELWDAGVGFEGSLEDAAIDNATGNPANPADTAIAVPGLSNSLPDEWFEEADATDPESEQSDGAMAAETAPNAPISALLSAPIASEPADHDNLAAIAHASPPPESELLPDATAPDRTVEPPGILTTYGEGQLRLQLDRTSFTLTSVDVLSLVGVVQADDSIVPQTRLGGLHLRLRLREPQSRSVLLVRQWLLPPTTGGEVQFERAVPLPSDITSKLILGELLLCDAQPQTLDQQSFTVTIGLESLLDNLVDRQHPPTPVVWQTDQWSDAKPQTLPMAQSTPNALNTTPSLLPSPAKPMLDLPGFAASPVSGIDKSQLLASLGLASKTADKTQDAGQDAAQGRTQNDDRPQNKPNEPAEPAIVPITDPDDVLQQTPDLADAEAALETRRRAATDADRSPLKPLMPPSHRNDRFVSRLNQIANDNELASWLSADELDELPAELTDGGLAPLTKASDVLSQVSEPEREVTREIVLDRPAATPQRPSFSRAPQSQPMARPVLPADTAIPSPELVVPPGHLTSGRSILVRARLPELNSRVYIKLWIYDHQNQALLDGPRWLTDFLPIGDGNVEGMMNLTVPYGGLDVQFEAIAVEIETERESYKTVVERRIVPTAPPTLPLEHQTNSPLQR